MSHLLRGAAALAGTLVAVGHAGRASALTQDGALEEPAELVDYYQVTCFDDGGGAPASLATQVRDAAPAAAPLVSVQTQKGFQATNSTDAVDADAGSSPLVWVNGGAGVYDVFVDKSGTGSENYTLTFQCKTGVDGGGEQTGTTIDPIATGPSQVPGLTPLGAAGLGACLLAIAASALRAEAVRAPGRAVWW